MTDEVAALVLEDNRLQTLALSIAEARRAAMRCPRSSRLIEVLEEGGQIDRTVEGLADAATLLRRALEGRGLTRPELAVVLSSRQARAAVGARSGAAARRSGDRRRAAARHSRRRCAGRSRSIS